MYEEVNSIASINIKDGGTIDVLGKVTINKDGIAIATNYSKHTLIVNDTRADEVLGVGTYWRNLAQYAWDNLPTN